MNRIYPLLTLCGLFYFNFITIAFAYLGIMIVLWFWDIVPPNLPSIQLTAIIMTSMGILNLFYGISQNYLSSGAIILITMSIGYIIADGWNEILKNAKEINPNA